MKKLLCALLCFAFVFALTGCTEEKKDEVEKPAERKKYELSERLIPDDVEFKLVDQNGKVWLENKHVEKVMICMDEQLPDDTDPKGRYLELRLTELGQKQFKVAAALKDKTGNLTIVVNGEKFGTPVIAHEKYTNCAVLYGDYPYIMKSFNAVK